MITYLKRCQMIFLVKQILDNTCNIVEYHFHSIQSVETILHQHLYSHCSGPSFELTLQVHKSISRLSEDHRLFIR